ncbi:protein yellow [Diabrotica virgifera virgifera]|uniref:Protein yellow n=1 Tax=Diabrotica virgifera virgifera TaxID=50390 RepID=A0A6P7G385_DIAVI|nr:protein yellow [Diabrotica virgifera virgifera]
MILKSVILVSVLCISGVISQLQDVFEWKELTFAWPNEEAKNAALTNGDYVPKNNLPLGLARWKDKLFVTVPRWKNGVAANLNYIPLNTTEKSPSLHPYPDWKANQIPKEGESPAENQIVSVFRLKVDECDRLWLIETGLSEILGNGRQVIPTSIAIFDLNTDQLIRRFNLPDTDIKGADSFFANIIVDTTKSQCDKAFAYLPDLGGYGIVVYSFADNISYRVKHNYFHFDPLKGNLNVGGVNFQWTDGVFSIALGPINETTGYRTAYFHALASCNEFSVSTEVLKNELLASDPSSFDMYKLEGFKNDQGQSTSSEFDVKANVLFTTQIQRDAIACWNPRKKLDANTFALVAQDHEKLIFTNDISIDAERNLWVLSDRLPAFIYRELNPNQINYRIMKMNIDSSIKGTPCEA